jgi:two-component system alkaline phosphatase synthesis response regulator PhoP
MASRILVADDDAQIVRLVQSYLHHDGFEVITAANGEQALHLMRSERPDLAVLDVMMPQRDGFSLLKLMRADAQLAATPVLLLTARVQDADRLAGLNLGADDYLTKPFNPPEVVARVRAILRRVTGQVKASPVLTIRGLLIDTEAHAVKRDGEVLELTPTEFALLRVLAQNAGRPMTRGELAESALGDGFDGFDRTIDSHIKNLRRKVELDSAKPRYVETVFGVGYKISP